MFAITIAEPIIAPAPASDHSVRPPDQQRTITEQGLLAAPANNRPGDRPKSQSRPPSDPQSPSQPQSLPSPPPVPRSNGTIFAAAILAGALTPTPKTLGQLYARIGTSDIPAEAQNHLRNLLV